jgi:hypothetical protein
MTFLQQRKKSCRASELWGALTGLGFEVRDTPSAGHKVVQHPGLKGFTGSSYNAGHGKNDEVKVGYIQNMLRLLRQYEVELEEFLKERQR